MMTTDHRLLSIHRLKDSFEVKQVRNLGQRHFLSPLVVYVQPNLLGHPRLGFIVTRKAGSSVTRNKIKRQVREFFRCQKLELGSCDYLFVAARPLGIKSRSFWRIWKKKAETWASNQKKS